MRNSLHLSLVRLLLWFILGIVLYGSIAPIPLILVIPLLFLSVGLHGLFCLVFYKDLAYSSRWIPGIPIVLFYLLCGYVLAMMGSPDVHPLHITRRTDPVEMFIGT